VLIKTRDLVQAIENWMKETDGLSCLNPVKLQEHKTGLPSADKKYSKYTMQVLNTSYSDR
jgi:hypothetical protein